MAANTPINLTLKAADWETVIGIMSMSADPQLQDLIYSLQTFYRAASPKPLLTSNITIATVEDVVVRISTYLYGNTVMNIATESASAFTRVMAAIRAANNVADNYISTQLATNDAKYAATALAIRKSGRTTIMMLQFDNT